LHRLRTTACPALAPGPFLRGRRAENVAAPAPRHRAAFLLRTRPATFYEVIARRLLGSAVLGRAGSFRASPGPHAHHEWQRVVRRAWRPCHETTHMDELLLLAGLSPAAGCFGRLLPPPPPPGTSSGLPRPLRSRKGWEVQLCSPTRKGTRRHQTVRECAGCSMCGAEGRGASWR
jgi:hypothetical protein